jgi:citrate lyase subunit beta / citryl-CoA lyase
MRSKLFVPGSRPELFDKAFASPADAISFDLEDAVAATRKHVARRDVAEALGRRPSGRRQVVIVRVNPLDSKFFADDLDDVVREGLDVLNLHKIESSAEIRDVAGRLAELERERGISRPIELLANIETPRGLRLAAEIATADRRVVGLQIGFGDLFEPYGIGRSEPIALNAVRLAVRLAAAEASIAAYDGAFVDVANLAGFRAEAEEAKRFGFSGKSCIHPSQIAIANAVFMPTLDEVARARKILAAADEKLASGVGAFTLDGVMIDEPFIAQARVVVARAAGAEND